MQLRHRAKWRRRSCADLETAAFLATRHEVVRRQALWPTVEQLPHRWLAMVLLRQWSELRYCALHCRSSTG